MQTAAEHWQSILHDNRAMTIVYGYDALSGGKVGQTYFTAPDGSPLDGAGDIVQTLPTSAVIGIDTGTNWFLDPTPEDHSEFAMQQILYRDLPNNTQTFAYSGSPPDLLEAGYWGDALPAAPAAAQNSADMLSVVLHEMGHALGMLNELGIHGGVHENADGDYDVHWTYVFGQVMATDILGTDGEHLASPHTLMFSPMALGRRYLPSATDIFAVAAAADWQDVHLPRRDFLGGFIWNLDGGWVGALPPESNSDAWVRHGDVTGLFADGEAWSLVVRDDSTVQTNNFTLTVSSEARVEGGTGTGESAIEVEGDLIAGLLTAADGGRVEVQGGHAQALGIVTEPGGILVGQGNASMWALDNNGTLAGQDSGTLIVNTVSGALDLDGAQESGLVDATTGSIRLADGLSDAFDGDMIVGHGESVEVVPGWTVGPGGLVSLAGESIAGHARIEGGAMVLEGSLEATGRARIDADLTIESSASVVVDQDATLEFQGDTVLDGGTHGGLGTIRLNGPTVVTGSTTMQAFAVDLDGFNGATVTTILSETLHLQVDRLNSFSNHFDGQIDIHGTLGRLILELDDPAADWRLEGEVNLHASNSVQPLMLDGSDIHVTGALSADGWARVGANLDVQGTLTTADSQAELILESAGVNIFRHAAAVNGLGSVRVAAGTTLQLEDFHDSWMKLNNGGRVEPGVGLGSAKVFHYQEGRTGTLAIEIGGLTPGNKHDQLRVLGNASVAGTLEVQLTAGFSPVAGDEFLILESLLGSVAGTWSSTSLPSLGRSLAWEVDHAPQSVTLRVVAVP